MRTCYSRCQDLGASSLSTGASPDRSLRQDFNRISESFGMREELIRPRDVTDNRAPPASRQNAPDMSFDSTINTNKVQVHPTDASKTALIANDLSPALESALVEFLRERWEIFTWCPADMPGVPREFAEHALNVFRDTKPVKQSIRRLSEPWDEAIGIEINRLLAANFITEIKESEWLANTVMVPKKDTDILRMCVDFTSLNKHCPKDHFPLPRIDQIIDSTAGCEKLSFLDAYSGYNQIRLKVEDQEKTAFITPFGVFCYNTMPFGLKNAGATYQRCIQAC